MKKKPYSTEGKEGILNSNEGKEGMYLNEGYEGIWKVLKYKQFKWRQRRHVYI